MCCNITFRTLGPIIKSKNQPGSFGRRRNFNAPICSKATRGKVRSPFSPIEFQNSGHGPKRFNEIRRDVGNCNPSTLSERLEMLERQGIITKTIHSTMPPRTSYALTCAGFELQTVMASIDNWARTYWKPTAKPELEPA